MSSFTASPFMPGIPRDNHISVNFSFFSLVESGARRRTGLLFLLCLFAASLGLNSQSFNFNNFSVDKGLSQSEAKCMKEDSRGYLWVGTAGGGVCRFNGEEFLCYEEKDGLAGQIVTCIEEDSNGNMWFGTTWGGVSRFDGKNFTNYNTENGLLTNSITSLMSLDGEQMLVGTNSGLTLIEGKNIRHFKNHDIDGILINFMVRDQDSSVLIVTDRSVVRYKNTQFNKLFDLRELGNVVPSCFTRDAKNLFWMGTLGKGIYSLSFKKNIVTVDTFIYNDKIQEMEITSIFFDQQDNLWFTSNGFGAAWVKKNGDMQFFNKQSGLTYNSILCGVSDHFGNIWMGTSGGGLVKFSSGAFLSYANYEGFKNNNVFAVLCDNEKTVWAGVYGLGVFRLKGAEVTKFTEAEGLNSNFCRVIYQDSKRRIWVGTTKGLSLFSGGRFLDAGIPGIDGMNIRSMCEDSSGNLFIGTNGNGLFMYNGKETTSFTDKNSELTHMYIHSLLTDKKGRVWIGTGNGVHKFENGQLTNFKLSSGFCNAYIGSIAEDKYGNIWFGTDRCLTCYNGSQFRSYTENDGLASGIVYLLITDKSGNVWMGSNKGLDKIYPGANGEVKQIINYGQTEGFKGVECNSRAAARDLAGNLWFGTVNGVFEYRPANDNLKIVPPKIHITNIEFFNQELNDELYNKSGSGFVFPERIKLPHNVNHITFEFEGIQHLSPEKVKYQYRLLGFDKNWLNAGKNKRISYTNLSPGEYRFEVMAVVNGVFSAEPAAFKFVINPPFWKRWWFVTLLAAAVLASFYALERIRRRRNEIAKIRLENQVAKRTAEILKQKREIETLLKEIHHRVKNNLQIINSLLNIQSSYIKDEESLKIFEECKNRIITMSIIHEKLYESKDLGHLNLKAYLEKLTGFLERAFNIEKKITFAIELQDTNEIGLDTIIPIGLLVNEIVSNSLKYAFEGKAEGRIEIRIAKIIDNRYELVIGDNGSGFDFEGKKEKNASFGIELISILSEQLNGEITLLQRPGTWYSLVFEKIDKSTSKQP
jgi:two-component sensor histidine kinase/ligand-binding sensor domain-containing protein